eukprot:TRINITY_DN5184_c0_g2_i1.p1 TRINITY_DN5184_c0_g2~~TRINITY_DN5184_c0_g2_i1.p1  ORF type:complete len:749 (+),score=225.86 TRINITY_DN5184_c0_g2_i1:1466-3712(+)
MYDVQQKRTVAELTTPFIKYAIWSTSDNNANVALIGKDAIIISNRKLDHLCTVHETIRIKSGCWDETGNVFIYNTLNHVKYCLINGDNGIIRTLDTPVYITGVKGNKVFCLDREVKNRVLSIDTTEYMFKLALLKGKYGEVLKMVKESNLIGQAIIGYLQKKGHPGVALCFVRDPKTRFNLALECGNLEEALESAKQLDDKECWYRLGLEALRQGNHQVVEMAYQKTRNFERLSFLYLITGNTDKLRKMLKIAEMRADVMGRFHNSLFLGDAQEIVKIMDEVGQTGLAYIGAKTYGLEEAAAALAEKIGADLPDVPLEGTLLQPPVPIMRLHDSNWPLLNVGKSALDIFETDKLGAAEAPEEIPASAGWGGEDELDLNPSEPAGAAGEGGEWEEGDLNLKLDKEGEGNGWEGMDALEGLDSAPAAPKTSDGYYVPPTPGTNIGQIWTRNSRLAVDHVAAGSFESAMQIFHQQIGVVNFAPLKPFFLSISTSAKAVLNGISTAPSLSIPLNRTQSELGLRGSLPALTTNLASLIDKLKSSAYRATTEGKFGDSLTHFTNILHSIPFLVVDKKEAKEVKELLDICREYILGLRMEVHRKELAANPSEKVRNIELAAYFTHCNLQPVHLMLALRSAMVISYKANCFAAASSFARRLLELNPKPDIATQARQVVKACESKPNNDIKINYDERNPFATCGISYVPIYKGHPVVQCPFCETSFLPQHKGQVCSTCQLSEIGKESSGLQLFISRN